MKELIYIHESGALVRFQAILTKGRYRILHIMDENRPDTRTVTNTVNSDFIENVCEDLDILHYDRVFLYGTDGVVCEWKNNGFHYVNSLELNKYGYEDFIREMVSRKAKCKGI